MFPTNGRRRLRPIRAGSAPAGTGAPGGGSPANAGTGTLVIQTLQETDSYTMSGYVRNGAGATPFGTLAVTKQGAGTQTFSGANITYTGATSVQGGTLEILNTSITNVNSTYASTLTTVESGATFKISNLSNQNIAAATTLNNGATLTHSGTSATLRRSDSSVISETDCPSIVIRPPSSSNWRSSSDTSVDLPAPLWPTRPTFSPPATSRLKQPSKTRAFLYEKSSFSKRIRALLTRSGRAPGRSTISCGESSRATIRLEVKSKAKMISVCRPRILAIALPLMLTTDHLFGPTTGDALRAASIPGIS